MRRVHIIVKGMVQGVGFRYYVVRQAEICGVGGWVRNCFNGEVEITAEGEDEDIAVFVDKVSKGPNSARVKNAIVNEREYIGEFKYFDVYPTA